MRRNHLLFGDGVAALRFFFTLCGHPERHGKIIVISFAARCQLRDVIIIDVRILVIVSSLDITTSVAGVEMVRVDFVTSFARVTLIAIVVSSFFIVVFLSMTFLPAPFHACCRRVAYRDRLHHRGCCEKVYCYVGRVRRIPIYRRRHGVNRRFVDLPRRYARLLSYRPRLRLRALQSA